jgi:hypothetical protein
MKAAKGSSSYALSAQAQPSYEAPVTLDVLFLQVLQETAPPADHLQKASPGMEIVLVLAHVLGQMPDAAGEHGDLDLWRPRVTIVGRVLPHYFVFVLYYRQLLCSSLLSYSFNLFL